MEGLRLKKLFCVFIFVCIIWLGKVQAQVSDEYIESYVLTSELTHTLQLDTQKRILLNVMNMTNEQHLGRELVIEDIESISYIGTYKFVGMESDSYLIFKVQFDSMNLPGTFGHYTKIFIVNNKAHKLYLIDLDTAEPIKVRETDSIYYFAGRNKGRYCYGTFNIYKFDKDILTLIYQTDEYVSNYSLDCISYENDDLELKNVDTNGDKYLDLKFTGTANYYCIGKENYGREDRKPIKSKSISLIYKYIKEKKTWIFDEKKSVYVTD